MGVKLALKHLGVDPTSFGLRSCLDSRLLQLGVAAVLPERAEGEPQDEVTTVLDLAQHPDFLKDFGDVAELAVRMVQIYQGQGRARWLNKDTSEMEATLMIATIQSQQGNDGASVLHPFTAAQTARLRTRLERDPARAAVWTWTRKGQPRLNPCPHCGGSWLAPVRFPEALGYLCLECRRDGGSAVTWPVRFDRWVSRTELWVDAGSPITASQPAVVGLPTRTPRQRRELDNSERATILALYGDRGVRVKSIQRNFNVSAETIMAIVKEAGVPTRYAATRRRWGSEDRQA